MPTPSTPARLDDPHNDLIYQLNDRPRGWISLLAAFQHLLAIIVPIVTPGLLICQALGVSARDTNLIVSMSLVVSGIATYVQCRRFGPLGAGLLIVQGTSFNFVGPLIAGGALMVKDGTRVEAVMAAIFGVVIAGSFIEIGVSRILPFVKRLITPLVTGIVVLPWRCLVRSPHRESIFWPACAMFWNLRRHRRSVRAAAELVPARH